MRTRFGGLALLLASSANLAACASIPDLGTKPAIRPPASYASTESLASAATQWPNDDWWRAYRDPQLDGLIAEALVGSPDLAAAEARLRTAQGYARQAGAALIPAVEAMGNAGVVQQSENNGIPAPLVANGWREQAKIGLGLSFNLDLWGKNRAALAAATSDAEAARYGVAEARLALTTGIASAYADLARLYAIRDTIEATLTIRSDTARLVSSRVTSGLDTKAELKQAESRVPATRAELAAIDEAIALSRNAIAALLGAGPDRGLSIARPAVGSLNAVGVPQGASIDLVGRRPDIAAARAVVEADAARINVARASFYPDINISALIGLQSLGFGNLLKGGSAFGSAGPAISLPIFAGGRLSGQFQIARGSYDEAVSRYDAAIVLALREVADALTSQKWLSEQLTHAREALATAEEANNLARLRYKNGLSAYLDVLSAEERVVEARRSVAELEARTFILDVAIVRALGGGFHAT